MGEGGSDLRGGTASILLLEVDNPEGRAEIEDEDESIKLGQTGESRVQAHLHRHIATNFTTYQSSKGT